MTQGEEEGRWCKQRKEVAREEQGRWRAGHGRKKLANHGGAQAAAGTGEAAERKKDGGNEEKADNGLASACSRSSAGRARLVDCMARQRHGSTLRVTQR